MLTCHIRSGSLNHYEVTGRWTRLRRRLFYRRGVARGRRGVDADACRGRRRHSLSAAVSERRLRAKALCASRQHFELRTSASAALAHVCSERTHLRPRGAYASRCWLGPGVSRPSCVVLYSGLCLPGRLRRLRRLLRLLLRLLCLCVVNSLSSGLLLLSIRLRGRVTESRGIRKRCEGRACRLGKSRGWC